MEVRGLHVEDLVPLVRAREISWNGREPFGRAEPVLKSLAALAAAGQSSLRRRT